MMAEVASEVRKRLLLGWPVVCLAERSVAMVYPLGSYDLWRRQRARLPCIPWVMCSSKREEYPYLISARRYAEE